MSATPRRFIAGAVCPRCGKMDKIVAFVDEQERQVRECVDCGFNEKLRDTEQTAGAEQPVTRVTRPKPVPASQVKAQPIRFFGRMPGKKSGDDGQNNSD